MPRPRRLTPTRDAHRPRDPIRAYREASRQQPCRQVRAVRPSQPYIRPPLTDLQLLNDEELEVLANITDTMRVRARLADAEGIEIASTGGARERHS